jgi:putative colanic acid biosynthesis glycosyltransferase WcaI
MHILLLSINYWPDETGIAPFATDRCEYLAARGHQVTVCTGLPYYPQWRVSTSYKKHPFLRQQRRGVTILRSWMYVPRKCTSLRRILHEASFVCSSFVRAVFNARPDILFVTSPPFGLTASAIALSRVWGVPYVLDVADLQPDTALDLDMLHPGSVIRTLYQLETAAYKNAALVSTLNEPMRRRIIAKGACPNKVAILSSWSDPELLAIPPLAKSGGETTDRPFVVSHFGNMGVKQGLEVVVQAAELSRDDKKTLYSLIGDGVARAKLEAYAQELNLPNLRFLTLQPKQCFLKLLAQSDVGLVTQRRSVADVLFPSKMMTLLAAARPVIASVDAGSEVARVISASRAGIVVPPEDPKALVEAVEHLRAHPSLCGEMGAAGRAYAFRRWERGVVLKQMEDRLVGLLGEREEAAETPSIRNMGPIEKGIRREEFW